MLTAAVSVLALSAGASAAKDFGHVQQSTKNLVHERIKSKISSSFKAHITKEVLEERRVAAEAAKAESNSARRQLRYSPLNKNSGFIGIGVYSKDDANCEHGTEAHVAMNLKVSMGCQMTDDKQYSYQVHGCHKGSDGQLMLDADFYSSNNCRGMNAYSTEFPMDGTMEGGCHYDDKDHANFEIMCIESGNPIMGLSGMLTK